MNIAYHISKKLSNPIKNKEKAPFMEGIKGPTPLS